MAQRWKTTDGILWCPRATAGFLSAWSFSLFDATRETHCACQPQLEKNIVGSSTGFSAHILVHRQRAVVERVNEPKSALSSIGPPRRKNLTCLQIKSYPKAPDPVAFGSSCSGLNHLPAVKDLVGPGQSSLAPLLFRCRCMRTSFP